MLRLTFALEIVRWGCEEELVSKRKRFGAASDARLHVIPLNPFGEPA